MTLCSDPIHIPTRFIFPSFLSVLYTIQSLCPFRPAFRISSIKGLKGSALRGRYCHEPYSTPSICHLIQISFRSFQTFHQRFRHFRHFQTLHHFVAPSLVTRRFVTRHPSHRHSVIPSPLFFIISFRHYRPSLFRISSTPIKFRASFSVMWLDDHHLTSLHSCGEQLFYCSSDLMISFLVILFSTIYLRISVYCIRNSCSSARLQFVID